MKQNKIFKLVIILFVLFLGLLIFIPLFAGNTQFIVNNTFDDFKKGEFINTSLTVNGEVFLCPEYKEILNNNDMYVWSSAFDSQGNMYACVGGDKGVIYKITPKMEVSNFYESPGIGLNIIEAGKDDELYLGINPNGLIYKILPDKTEVELTSIPERYIWDLEIDSKGNIYAATGIGAVIYKITSNGDKEILYNAETERHILKMLLKNNILYFVTEGNGLLYKCDLTTNNVEILYDAYEDEIKDLCMDSKGNIVFCTSTTSKKKAPTDFNYTDSFLFLNGKGNSKANKKAVWKNSAYKINTNGAIDKFFTKDKDMLLSLTSDNLGNIYIGSGVDGIIYKIDSNNIPSIYISSREKQIYSLLFKNDMLFALSCNMGKIFKISLNKATKGEYISEIFNTTGEAIWGKIMWKVKEQLEGKITLQVRTGNSETPDNTWSKWSNVFTNPLGSNISLAPARFIQYKANFTSNNNYTIAPGLLEVKISYVMVNRKPIIKSFDIKLVDGDNKDKEYVNTKYIELSWKTEDLDSDILKSSIYFRKIGSEDWVLLKSGMIDEKKLTISQKRIPDGVYEFMLVVNDGLSNNIEDEKEENSVSRPFIVDSTPPILYEYTISGAKNDSITIKGTVKDKLSFISRIEYSVNSSTWYYLPPEDSIFDSEVETFTISLNLKEEDYKIKTGKNYIILKMIDLSGNISSEILFFEN